MKLCKDCKWYWLNYIGSGCCSRLYGGERFPAGWRCSAGLQRESGWFGAWFMNTCGLRARWFEPKEPE